MSERNAIRLSRLMHSIRGLFETCAPERMSHQPETINLSLHSLIPHQQQPYKSAAAGENMFAQLVHHA